MFTKIKENVSSIIFYENIKKNNKTQKDIDKRNNQNIVEKKTTIKALNFHQQYFSLINLILFELILILLPKRILLDEPNIELKVNSKGYHQILSERYTGIKPSLIFVNNELQNMKDLKIYVGSSNYIIRLEWENTLTDFTYMFSNITSITSVKMNYISGNKCNMSYMFYNCSNLKNFEYISNYDYSHVVLDTIAMFYNCVLLTTFSFDELYMGCYSGSYSNEFYICNSNYKYSRNMSYMFYNCQKLERITYEKNIIYVNDMRGMFYNCQSLRSFNLDKFITSNNINEFVDLSYMFYNCKKLQTFLISNKFCVKDMNNMFYNCESLRSINMNYFYSIVDLHVNMSRLFYNCINLVTVETNFNNFYISDTREMFFNCISFNYLYYESGDYYSNIYINIYQSYCKNCINMSKMFYNCKKINSITISGYYSYNSRIPVNDFNSMFYNCISLTSINLYYFDVSHAQNMSYMFYNCKQLEYFNLDYFSYNSIVEKRTMKGMFQNCESLYSLDLRNNFYTKNVEIMWDMFKDCSNLTYLYLTSSSFDTSKVTDMESMFEGCYNLISLNLNYFNTQNVIYMNRMFYNCLNLKFLYFQSISANSLATMQQMFYNCVNLTYLDLYSLTENDQSIVEMFKGASNDFQFCIEENENIPNIFKELLEMNGTSRDCSSNCYNNPRRAVPENKLCCKYVEYNRNCYDKCPSRTKADSFKNCKNFSCTYYYNYHQDGCESSLPNQYYVNDTKLKTIDKCHPDCFTCSSKALDSNHTNCLTCVGKKYIYLGNCYSECLRGSYLNYTSGNRECYCFDEKCIYCPETYAKQGLCSQCNNTAGYYKREIDLNPPFDCFKQLDKYYLDKNHKILRQCYKSCKTCNQSGINSRQHNCLSCDSEYSLVLKKGNYLNCYSNCSYYFYFNISNNYEYTCTENITCPVGYDLIAPDIGQCVQSCNETENYKYKFKNKCYAKCPEDTEEDKNEKYTCFLSCPFERPFKLVSQGICVSTCTINERRDKECVTNYFGNRTNEEIQNLILLDIEDHLTSNTFNYTNINDELYIIDETKTFYELTTTDRNQPSRDGISYVRLADCEKALRNFYSIDEKEPLYIFKFDYYIEGKEGPTVDYRVYYPLDDDKTTLDPLDLINCEGKAVFILFSFNMTGDPDLYDRNSPYYNDLCVSYSTSDGIDLTLEDRQHQYIENNKSLCEEDCSFVGYDSKTNLVECSCEVKFTLPLISEIRIDKNKLYKFIDIKKIANFDVLKCYKLLFSKVGIIKNFGFYLFIPTFIMYFVTIFIFYLIEFKLLIKQINDIAYAKKFQKYLKNKKDENDDNDEKKKSRSKQRSKPILKPKLKPQLESQLKSQIKPQLKTKPTQKPIIKTNYRFVNPIIVDVASAIGKNLLKNSEIKIESKINKDFDSKTNRDDLISNNSKEEKTYNTFNQSGSKKDKMNAPPFKGGIKITNKTEKNSGNRSFNSSKSNLKLNKNISNLNTDNNNNNKAKTFDELTEEEKERIRMILKYNDSELNGLDYKKALKYDDRNYFQYYWALLRTKHLIVKVISKTDYNSRIIKIFLCFFNFSLSFTINTLFFNDDTMHKILEDEGDFNFIYQLPQIIYSAVISTIFENFLSFLSLSEENILSLKNEKVLKNVPKKAKKIIRSLQIKFVNFFILSFLFLMGFCYYVSCFCAVYKNTQYHLIKDSFISFGTSLATPLGISLIPGLFRIPGIKGKNELLYLLSKIIQLI